MRDLRLGKARMIIPNSYLQNQGRGKGATFDADQEYFQAFEMLGDSAEMKEVQFKIRVDEHERTCNSLVRQIIRGAGFSAASFVEDSSVALTATEVVAREKRTLTTRDKKIRYWKDQLSYILGVLLEVDTKIFGSGIVPENPKVEFSTVVREQPLVLANTLKILSDAGAVSTYQKIKMLHPTWTQEEVDEEVQRLVGSLTSGN
jgi:A118 family predicted phage portal protein